MIAQISSSIARSLRKLSINWATLYGALEVKRKFHDMLFFLHPNFFVRPESPFLRPDPQRPNAVARRAVKVGRRSDISSCAWRCQATP